MSSITDDLPVCPRCGSTYIVGVQYSYTSPEHYDGISELYCPKGETFDGDTKLGEGCGYREGRWSGKELKDGEIEPRWGGKQ